jgi:hypothetical protein
VNLAAGTSLIGFKKNGFEQRRISVFHIDEVECEAACRTRLAGSGFFGALLIQRNTVRSEMSKPPPCPCSYRCRVTTLEDHVRERAADL